MPLFNSGPEYTERCVEVEEEPREASGKADCPEGYKTEAEGKDD